MSIVKFLKDAVGRLSGSQEDICDETLVDAWEREGFVARISKDEPKPETEKKAETPKPRAMQGNEVKKG